MSNRCVRDSEFFGQNVSLEKASFATAVLFGPGHSNPTLFGNAASERSSIGTFVLSRIARIKRPSLDLLGEKSTRFPTQILADGGKPNGIKDEFIGHGIVSRAPIAFRFEMRSSKMRDLPERTGLRAQASEGTQTELLTARELWLPLV
jgi:hypothetical protein